MKFQVDSRKITDGQIFVAIKGHTVDGHDYIDDAIKNGASKIIAEHEVKCSVPVEVVPSTLEYLKVELKKEYADKIYITTDDGSVGFKGFTIQLMPEILKENNIDAIYTCGPNIMMEGVAKLAYEHDIDCQVSLEKRMACGIGVCLGCTFEGKLTKKRRKVCTEGPVFEAKEVF